MLYLAAVAAVAVATTGKPYRPPNAIPPAEGLDNPNAGQKNEKIEHFVVLFMENRTPDHIWACDDLPTGDFVKDGHFLPIDPADPSKGGATLKCGSATYVCPKGPGFDMWGLHFKPGADEGKYPYGEQDDKYSSAHGAAGVAVTLFGKGTVPVKSAIARQFSIFNNYHSSVPSYSTPNHLYAQSATSCGIDDNIHWNDCGGSKASFPQRTIYDNLAEGGVSFGIYSNHTPHSADTDMDGVQRHVDKFLGYTDFFGQAANGTLPSFSFVQPGNDPRNGKGNSDHPCNDVALGERLVKDVYESLRAGPGWNKTLFLVTYDDAGGFYDHVIPPHEGIVPDESSCVIKSGCHKPFDFKRVGSRVVSFLMSPWIPAGVIMGPPKKGGPLKTNGTAWEHSAISATIVDLFGLPKYLTKRDSWAGSFSELLTETTPRDTPMHLPDAPPPSQKAAFHSCGDKDDISRMQRRNVDLWTRLNGVAPPDNWQAMGYDELDAWIRAQYQIWRHGDRNAETVEKAVEVAEAAMKDETICHIPTPERK